MNSPDDIPWLIQGGMGIAVSGWPLARVVAKSGQLGVVSGTAIDAVFARRLQDDGVDDNLRAVLDRFPVQSIVDEVLRRYATTRREPSSPYKPVPMLTHRNVQRSVDLVVLAAFVEVALAKEGHDGRVGINLLTKVQLPTVPTLFGAMLADVDYVLMGAGVPTHIPGILQQLALLEGVETTRELVGDAEPTSTPTLIFDPSRYTSVPLSRPKFIGIVSSHVLATALAKRSNGPIDGFVVERPSAGGHNAPPRGKLTLDEDQNPVYGDRDRVDYAVLRELGIPFWIGGGISSSEKVREALGEGASGVQVGTLFAYCRESGLDPMLRARVLDEIRDGSVTVATSVRASTTGYPFKVASVAGTLSEPVEVALRERNCDLGYLRDAFAREDGTIGYRCPGEPVDAYLAKGGTLEETVGRLCLCNGLMAACGLGQVRSDGVKELPVVTSGDCVNEIRQLLGESEDYGANDVISFLDPSV